MVLEKAHLKFSYILSRLTNTDFKDSANKITEWNVILHWKQHSQARNLFAKVFCFDRNYTPEIAV